MYFCRKNYDMNIQARKLLLIEEFLRISDEHLIAKLESFIRQENKETRERELAPMSLNELHEMIALAIQDSDAGRVISHQELKKKVKTWK
jgi:siroheme synthase (precorrin-2 oxidase/ferrochelatase)